MEGFALYKSAVRKRAMTPETKLLARALLLPNGEKAVARLDLSVLGLSRSLQTQSVSYFVCAGVTCHQIRRQATGHD